MRFAALALLVAVACEAQPRVYDRACDVASRRSDRGGVFCSVASSSDPDAPFSFTLGVAENGTAACTGADLVASYNGASTPVTVTRSTAAWCTKGNETKDIANGDMVSIPANKPRWMPGGEGDAGMGVAVWGSRTNHLKHSQSIQEDAGWRTAVFGGTIAITPNAAVAPDGTMTADLVECTNRCYVAQDVCPTSVVVRSAYVRLPPLADGGVATSTNVAVGGGVSLQYTPVTSASWTRIVHDDPLDLSVYYGIYYWDPGGDLPPGSFYAWQADCQDNTQGGFSATHPTPPPITTTTSTVTTADEVVRVSAFTFPDRMQVTYLPQLSVADAVPFTTGDSTDGLVLRLNYLGAKCENRIGGVADTVTLPPPSIAAGGQVTLSCDFSDFGRLELCAGGTCADAGSLAPLHQDVLTIGSEPAPGAATFNYQANGVLKELSLTSKITKDIYLVGDSIVAGTYAGTGQKPEDVIPRLLGSRVTVTNDAVSSYSVEACKTAWDARLANIVSAGAQSWSYMMVQCGINSAAAPADGGTALSNVTSHLQAMLLSGKDAGVHVLWSTITPGVATCAGLATPVNSAMATFCSANNIPVADTFTLLKDPATCSLAAAYDVGDGLHPNDAGTYVESQEWIRAGGWTP